MKWLLLVVAGIFEVFWAIGLKYSQGFTKLVPSIFTLLGMIASFYHRQTYLDPRNTSLLKGI